MIEICVCVLDADEFCICSLDDDEVCSCPLDNVDEVCNGPLDDVNEVCNCPLDDVDEVWDVWVGVDVVINGDKVEVTKISIAFSFNCSPFFGGVLFLPL